MFPRFSITMLDQLHPHLSIFDIVLHCIKDFLSIGNIYDLEFHITELDLEKDIVLPDDDDSAIIDWGVNFEADAIVRKEDELGGISNYFLC